MNSNYSKAINSISQKRQNAILESENRKLKIFEAIPLAKELDNKISNCVHQFLNSVLTKKYNSNDIDKLMTESTKYQSKLKNLLFTNGYDEDYLDIKYSCAECEDTGFVNGKKCICFKNLLSNYSTDEFYTSLNLKKFKFEDFSIDFYKTPQQIKQMNDIFIFCKQYAKQFHKNSQSIVMLGQTGLGKTHLTISICNEVLKNGFSVLYSSAPDLFRELQQEYYGKSQDNIYNIKNALTTDLLIIDDLGTEIENQISISNLYNIINTRMNSSKPTIINTNLNIKEIETRYSPRIVSRITASFQGLKFIGTDVRQKIGRAHV